MLALDIAWKLRRPDAGSDRLVRAAQAAARAEGFGRGFLSIAVVGLRAMARLHRAHLGVPGPTDVLTFDLGSDVARGALAGEVIVCAGVAERVVRPRTRGPAGRHRAAPSPRSPLSSAAMAELARYVVHGVLHLAGYDDASEDDFAAMHRREDEILRTLGVRARFDRPAARGGRPRSL